MNFLNIEKNTILRFFCTKFHVFFAFHAISNIKKKFGVQKIPRGGGGLKNFFFLEKQFFLISRLKKILLKSAHSLTG